MPDRAARRLPIGAEVVPGGVDFRVWAPRARLVEVLVEGCDAVALAAESDPGPGVHASGRFAAVVPGIAAGARYRFRVDGRSAVPDPASRFQPDGPHGPSEVIDPGAYAWSDAAWRGVGLDDAVIYELHVGTFTPEGTYAAAAEHLPDLAWLGVTVVELMPIADFPGAFGWGYDGVDLFAPTRLYGRPDDLRAFVDRAHALGIGVILDVVYNHFGPDGWYLAEFAETYASRRHESEWGETPNFDGAGSEGVREFVLANARAWIEEYHLDGLRLDATQQVFDDSAEHILAAIARTVREAAGPRRTLVVAENEPQDARLVRSPAEGGYGLDAIWNEDLHHAAVVALTGLREAYYSDYRGAPQEFVSAATNGFLFQGQYHAWQRAPRGSAAFDLQPRARISFLANHDQVANAIASARLPSPAASGRVRAITAFVLLCPGTPMLFMGQEWGASSPFPYFADHAGDLGRAVSAGRRGFLSQFPSQSSADAAALIRDPADRATFERAILDHVERQTAAGRAALALHRDLLALRRTEAAVRAASAERGRVDGAVLGEQAFVVRFFGDRPGGPDDRLLVVNLGPDVDLVPAPEPLLAPPAGHRWSAAWSSDDPRYGGPGRREPETDVGWSLPGEAAVVLAPVRSAAGASGSRNRLADRRSGRIRSPHPPSTG